MSKLITYPTTKLAKEKGCKLDLYYGDSKIFNQPSAPSQENIQDWLIEKHGIAVLVDLNSSFDWIWKIIPIHKEASQEQTIIQSIEFFKDEEISSEVYSTKQLALEEGLFEVLTKLK
jgi:CHAT domain-containing protein